MAETILGTRIRERRRHIGVTQADLARRIGISASYLNLIEHNKRQISGPLLRRTADALNLRLDVLDGAAERRLVQELVEVAHLPALHGIAIEETRTGEMMGRFPGWTRAVAALARSEREATRRAEALSDRLNHDPFLGETVHRMLSRITAIRSLAEILVDVDDVASADRQRFHRIIHEESRGLSEVAEALAAYFDRSGEAERTLTPTDEVEALFEARDNRFDELEAAAADHGSAGTTASPADTPPDNLPGNHLPGGDLPDGDLPDGDLPGGDLPGGDLAGGDDNRADRRQAAAVLAPVIDRIVDSTPELLTAAAQSRARAALLTVAGDALRMPMPAFAAAAAACRYDIERLAAHFRSPAQSVCRRLTALPPGPGVPRCGYVEANAAGTIIALRGLRDLAIPRYAPACPLWILFRGQQTPGRVLRQYALFPGGRRFMFVARARPVGSAGFNRSWHYRTDMLVMSNDDSRHTVYAPTADTPAEEVGTACRICPRRRCPHRVEDPLAG